MALFDRYLLNNYLTEDHHQSLPTRGRDRTNEKCKPRFIVLWLLLKGKIISKILILEFIVNTCIGN